MDELDEQADRLVEQGAPGASFEALVKQGWRPRSQRGGDGLGSCGPTCGVCHPTDDIRRREYLRRKAQQR
jgi:hypothetical protein